jgi:hypothetical protein
MKGSLLKKMAVSDVHPVHVFEPWQVWPGSYDNPPPDGNYPAPEQQSVRIDKQTPITSMGSCFAREIKKVLIEKGFAYQREETHHPASIHAGAAWERLYNTFSMRQIFQYSFLEWSPNLRWWTAPVSKVVQDPYRRIILYDSVDNAEGDFKNHRFCSRRVLEAARILILTLGLTEIWEDEEDGSVICLPSGPYVNEGGDMSRYRFRVSRYQENLENLCVIRNLLFAHNPACKIVVTVSPVNLWATFRNDCDVLTASCNSKATLRAAADEFASIYDNVSYFPAFEVANLYRPMMGLPVFTEGRENFHVNQETIDLIMDTFFRYYCEIRT